MDCSLPGKKFLHPWNFPGKNTGVVAVSSPGDLPDPGIEPRSSALQVDALPSELLWKPLQSQLEFIQSH